MKSFKEFLKESVIDVEHPTLDPHVWDNVDTDEPKLNDVARNQILLAAEQFIPVFKPSSIYLVGSLLTKRYSETSDLDVNLEVISDDAFDIESYNQAWRLANSINGQPLVGTAHPINFYVKQITPEEATSKNHFENFDNVYDIVSNRWLKKSDQKVVTSDKDIAKIEKQIAKIDEEIMKLRRNIVAYNFLSHSSNTANIKEYDKELEKTIKEIKSSTKAIVSNQFDIHQKRKEAFDKKMSKSVLEKYLSKNNFPENIIWKLLEKFHYIELCNRLDEILKNSEEFGKDEISNIGSAIIGFLGKQTV